MSTQELVKKFKELPYMYQAQIEQLINFSIMKTKFKKAKVKRGKAGFAKGTFTYISDDFNAPLDDFKDYM